MTQFLTFAAQGLATGFVVALFALSVVMIYRSTRVLSFAQGAIASLATYVFFTMNTTWNWSPVFALPLSLVVAGGMGIAADVAVMRPLKKANTLTRTVSTLGIVLVLQVIMRVVWGGSESFVKPLSTTHFNVGGFTIGIQEIVIALVAIAAAIALNTWTKRSYTGLGLSAIAEDASSARLLGVAPGKASIITWSIAAVLAGLAGILFTPLLVLNPWQMTFIMVTSFGAALAGGFMSLSTALFGGLAIGVVQSLSAGYIHISGVSEASGFIAVFAVLLATRGRKSNASVLRGGASAW